MIGRDGGRDRMGVVSAVERRLEPWRGSGGDRTVDNGDFGLSLLRCACNRGDCLVGDKVNSFLSVFRFLLDTVASLSACFESFDCEDNGVTDSIEPFLSYLSSK
jgi:hypothetical protein